MGGQYSITARNLGDKIWCVCDYNLSLVKFVFKSIYCLCKYDVVSIGKHGNGKHGKRH